MFPTPGTTCKSRPTVANTPGSSGATLETRGRLCSHGSPLQNVPRPPPPTIPGRGTVSDATWCPPLPLRAARSVDCVRARSSRRRPGARGEAVRADEPRPVDDLAGRRLSRAAAPLSAQAGLPPAQVPGAGLHRPGAGHQPDDGGRERREDLQLPDRRPRRGQARALPRHEAAGLRVLLPPQVRGERPGLRLQPDPREGHARPPHEPGLAVPGRARVPAADPARLRAGHHRVAGGRAQRRRGDHRARRLPLHRHGRRHERLRRQQLGPGGGRPPLGHHADRRRSPRPRPELLDPHGQPVRPRIPGRGRRSGRSGSATPGG